MTAAESALDLGDSNQPIGRFEWERIVKRARMPKGAKFLALILATFGASKDGSNVRPSVERLAREMEVSERTVNRSFVWLRENGWVTRVRRGNRWQGRTDEYRLTIPVDVLDRLWLDPDGMPISDMGVAQTRDV